MFINRQSTNSNRRRIDVKEVITDSGGNIKSIIADINRSQLEEKVTEAGTPLNAEAMTKAVLALVNKECFGIDVTNSNFNIEWKQKVNECNKVEYTINLGGPRLYTKRFETQLLEGVSLSNTQNKIVYKITEKWELNNIVNNSSFIIPFSIELYSDEACTKFVTRLNGTITYIPMSDVAVD